MKYILSIVTVQLLLSPHISFAKEDPIAFECSSHYEYAVKDSNMRGLSGSRPLHPLRRDSSEPDITPQFHRAFHLNGNQYVQSSVTMDDSKSAKQIYNITLTLTDTLAQKTQTKTYTYKDDRPPSEEFEIKVTLNSLKYNIAWATFTIKCSKVEYEQ